MFFSSNLSCFMSQFTFFELRVLRDQKFVDSQRKVEILEARISLSFSGSQGRTEYLAALSACTILDLQKGFFSHSSTIQLIPLLSMSSLVEQVCEFFLSMRLVMLWGLRLILWRDYSLWILYWDSWMMGRFLGMQFVRGASMQQIINSLKLSQQIRKLFMLYYSLSILISSECVWGCVECVLAEDSFANNKIQYLDRMLLF